MLRTLMLILWNLSRLICTPTLYIILQCTTAMCLPWLTMDRSWEIR